MPEAVAQTSVSLTIVRTLDAPPDEVFSAWTDSEVLRQWMGPGEVVAEDARADARVGGEFYIRMHTPDGDHPTMNGVFAEVVANERLAFTWQWEGSDVETFVTVEFRALDGDRTELTLTHERFPESEMRDKHTYGWTGCLAKLEARFAEKP